MGQEIGQSSPFPPAVGYDVFSSLFHMVFRANDNSNRILYATSPDGQNWTLGPDTGQTSGAAPALVVSQGDVEHWLLLLLVFVANDPSNRILYSILDLLDDPNTRGWRYIGQLGGESAQGVSCLGLRGPGEVTVYFTANDPSNRLLEHTFIPYP